MTANEPVSPDLDQALADVNRRRFKAYAPEPLAWLALPPAWTENLASACSFPTGSADLENFLEKAAKARLCTRDPEAKVEEATCESARTLAALWPYLDGDLRVEYGRVLENLALAIPDREEGIYLLTFATSNEDGSPDKVKRLISLIKEQSDVEVQARLLLQVALQFSQPEYLARAWEATDSIRVTLQRVMARISLSEKAASIPSFSWDKRVTVEEVEELSDPGQRAALLLKLNSLNFDRSLQPRIEDAIRKIADPSTQALYFSLLAKSAPSNDAAALALQIARSLPDAAVRCRTLATIAANFGDLHAVELLNEAWASASNVQDTSERTSLLVLTASQWAPLQGEAVLSLALGLNPAECRAEVLLACLSAEPLRTILTADIISSAFEEIPLQSLRTRLLIRLASLAPFRLLPDVLDRARSNQDDGERRNALLSLLPRLNERDRSGIAIELLDDLRRVGDAAVKRSALIQLVRFLDGRQLRNALQLATDSRSDRGFSVEETARRDILDYLRKEKGALFLYNIAYQLGQAITRSKNVGVTTGTARWAQIASLLRDPNLTTIQRLGAATGLTDTPPASGAGTFLTNQVRAFVDAGNTGAALAWLSSGQLLAPVAGGDVESAVLTGKHRVELSYRRSMDERHLRRYLERNEQTSAFVSLRDGPDSHWALHYLGVGGVGKTMLLRHIAARLAIRDGYRLATTRVDFDHISPEFPVRKPGQLLAELADELRIYGGSSRIEDKFTEFQDRLLALHAELSAQPPPEDPLRNVRSPAFQEVVSSFADLLRLLPPPVILILDTCEELSKLEPVASTLPSVEATFAILEQLQVYIPTVRVVFAGRRLLAQSGDSEAGRPARWKADTGALNERNRYLPDHKEYLRLHVIRGFTGRESDQFLEQIADLRLDSDRKTAILERSAEISKPVEIQWAEAHSEDRGPRYNPFDLALYAEWLRESPAVTASTIRSGQTEPYVEMRIVRRLENEPIIRRALPAAVLLRRFDDEMLRPVAPDDAGRAALFRDLQANEWTDAQRDEDLATWFLEVNPNLRSRIESYYAALPQRLELDRMREQLGPALDQRVRASLEHSQWFNQLNFSRVEPALRLQPPEAAALLWDAIDERVTGAAEWNWAFRICPQLLGEGNVAGKDNAPLQAAIRATLNAALLHLQRDFDPRPTWQEVARTSKLHPVPEIADWLKYRADVFAGEPFRVPEFANHYRQQQAYACLLGQTYEGRFPSTWLHLPAIPEALDFGTSELFDYRKELPQDLSCLYDFHAGTLKDVPEMRSLVQRWADWRIPDCLTDRLRLELALRAGVDAGKAHSWALSAWALSALDRLDNIDSERLLSALLNRDDVVTTGLMDRATAANYYDPERVPSSPAHRAARPLYAVLAEQCNQQGRPDDAIKVLDRVRSIMLDSRQPADAVREVDALAAQIREKTQVLPAQPAAAPAEPASRRFALFLLGLAVITVSIYGLYELTRWALGKTHILAFLSIVVCIPVIWYFVPILLEFMLREISVLLKPSLLFVPTGQRIHASYWRSGRRGPKWLPLPFSIDLRNRQAIFEEEFDLPPASAYSDTAVRLAHHMRRLTPSRFPGLKMPIRLEIGREIQGIAWEALINLGLAGPKGRVREQFQFWRGGEPDVSTHRAEWRESQSVVLLCRSRDLPAMERAWAGKISAPLLLAIDESNIPGSFISSRVMHLVGRTRRSSGERLFQLTPEHYLVPTNFPAEFVHIFIVQCQLVESLERTGTDREQSAALREFAAVVFNAGAKTVIFLPQMPVVISDKVLTRLVAFCARRREPSLFALLDTISDIRKIISKSISTTAATRTEAGQKYTHSESGSPGPSVEGEVVDSESLNSTRGEMSMDVTVWTRLA